MQHHNLKKTQKQIDVEKKYMNDVLWESE